MATMNVKHDFVVDYNWGTDLSLLWLSNFFNPETLTFTATKVTMVEPTGVENTLVWEVGGTFTRAADGSITGSVTSLTLSDLGPTGAGAKVQLMNVTGLNTTFAELKDIFNGVVSSDVLMSGNDTLTATGFVEDPSFPGSGVYLYGCEGNDHLTGTAYNDVLGGGRGNDTMIGGLGNDRYKVDSALDVVTELQNAGTDRVNSEISYTLGANLENLTLKGIKHINGTGNALNNSITGQSGNNVLNGGGGADTLSGGSGNDTLIGGTGIDALTGGAGNDNFRFNAALNATTNKDTIQDFVAANDTIQLENAVFTTLATTGTLNVGMLRAGAGFTTAADANDYIIYNQTTGALYYDADANGAGAAVQFAQLTAGTALTNADLVVI